MLLVSIHVDLPIVCEVDSHESNRASAQTASATQNTNDEQKTNFTDVIV